MIEKVTLVGAGNLATQLGKALKMAGVSISQVYSRTEKSASELANLLECPFTTSLSSLIMCDLVIVSVKDDALEDVLSQLKRTAVVVHTSGSIPMEIFEGHFEQFGVFYPLQTFSKQRDVDFSTIPICIESSSPELLEELTQLGNQLSNTVEHINSEKRKTLHLAAVFTCNFVNHFYQIGNALLEEQELNFDLLKPLIQETAQKVMHLDPIDAQTGPAVRFDETIINKHLNLLSDKPELKKIYNFVSENIYQTKNRS